MTKASMKRSVSRKAIVVASPAASLSAAANVLGGRKPQPQQQEAEQTNNITNVAISGVTLVEQRAKDFASMWGDAVNADLAALWDANEKRQRSVPEIMFDLRNACYDKAGYDEEQAAAAKANDPCYAPITSLPKPYTEAPKNVTPLTWTKTSNKPWPFDMWREKKSQAQGGERNVNQVFYLVSFDESDAGRELASQIKEVKEQLANATSASPKPLTGDYQGMQTDELQGLKGKLESRRNTAGNAIRNAVALHLQFAAFERLSDYCRFEILAETYTDTDGKTYQRPHSNKKHVRFAVCKVTKDKQGNVTNRETTWQPPISVETFLGYDVDVAEANLKVPGADTKTAIVSSGKVESDGASIKPVKIAVDSTPEQILSVMAILDHWFDNEPQRAAFVKMLGMRDAEKKYKNIDGIRSTYDVQVHLATIAQTYRNAYAASVEAEHVADQKTGTNN